MARTRIWGGLYVIVGLSLALLPSLLVSTPLTHPPALLHTGSALLLALVGIGYGLKPAAFGDSSTVSILTAAGSSGVLLGFAGIFVL